MKILLIDCNINPDSWGAPDLKRAILEQSDGLGATVFVRRAPQEDLPPDSSFFDRVIVSGSKTSALVEETWILKLDEFLKRTIERKQALLGVCYGHQSIVRVLGGRGLLRKGHEPEYGWTQIQLSGKSRLTEGLPPSFYSFSAHFEEVAQLPKGLRCLASSKDCAIQAFESEDRPIFGIQFHPERNAEEAERTFAYRRKLGSPKHLLHPGESKKYYNSEIGARIFKNFLNLG